MPKTGKVGRMNFEVRTERAIAEIANSLRQGTGVRLSEARVHGSDPVGTGAGG